MNKSVSTGQVTSESGRGVVAPSTVLRSDRSMNTENADETESTDSKLTVDHRSPTTVCGKSTPQPTGSAVLKTTVAFESPEITIDGWYTDDEARLEEQMSRSEVTIQISDSSLAEELSITTSVDAERARELGQMFLEAADIAEGAVKPETEGEQ